jgi:hypothetical protein
MVTVHLVEREQLGDRRLAPVGREVGDAGDEAGERRVARGERVAERDVRMIFPKAVLPDFQEAAEGKAVISDQA